VASAKENVRLEGLKNRIKKVFNRNDGEFSWLGGDFGELMGSVECLQQDENTECVVPVGMKGASVERKVWNPTQTSKQSLQR
jgi:hypothetical protein